uniref:Reverse transcriptase zinc-binding domain-containing protein n=1 Tax=Arundo donax TaxID=35708 RepID=A0A0A9GSE9_ARUDO
MDTPWVNLIWSTYYSHGQIPHATQERGSFWWKEVLRFCDHYRGIVAPDAGDGTTILLWQDVWNGTYFRNELPRLYTFAKDQNISLSRFMQDSTVQANFHLPLSQIAMEEMQQLQVRISSVQAQQQRPNTWVFCWGQQHTHQENFIH